MGLHVVHKLQAWAQSWNGTDGLLFCIGMGRARSRAWVGPDLGNAASMGPYNGRDDGSGRLAKR